MPSLRHQLTLLGRTVPYLPRLMKSQVGRGGTTGDLVVNAVRSYPDKTMVRFEDECLTFAQMGAAASRVGHWAHREGLRQGDVVALVMENRPEFLQTWMGLCQAGITTALINTNLHGKGLAHVLEAAEPSAVICGTELVDRLDGLGAEHPISTGSTPVWVRGTTGQAPSVEVTALPDRHDLDAALDTTPSGPVPEAWRSDVRTSDPLFFIYTSGTTGLPKAARFSHSRFLAAGLLALMGGVGGDDVIFCALPLYHTAGGVIGVNVVLQTGATLALARRFSASRFFEEAAGHDATVIQYIGELGRYLAAQPERPSDRAHSVRIAVGNGLPAEVWRSFADRFGIEEVVEFYAATEGNLAMVNIGGPIGSVGTPQGTTKVELVRFDVETGEPVRGADGRCVRCEAGEAGEALGKIVGGPLAAAFDGYTSKAATERKILTGVFDDGDRWFRSGDLLRRDADGWYWFVDRIGDTFRWKGENVSTQEVAEVISAVEGVATCAVYGVEIPGADGRAGMATLAADADDATEIDLEQLHEAVVEQLPVYARPAFLRVTEQIEATGTFKLRKVDLQEEGYAPRGSEDVLYYRDDAAGAYVPLDDEVRSQIDDGRVRF